MQTPLLLTALLATASTPLFAQTVPDQVLLKEYRRRSIFTIPETKIDKAKFPAIDMHIGEDQWMYEQMDEHNDGLMNGYTWRIPKDPEVLSHDDVLQTLENALKKHPRNTIIACHFANCCADLNRLGALLDHYPKLY